MCHFCTLFGKLENPRYTLSIRLVLLSSDAGMASPWHPCFIPRVSSPASTPSVAGEPHIVLQNLQMCRKVPWAPVSHLGSKEIGSHDLKGPALFQ